MIFNSVSTSSVPEFVIPRRELSARSRWISATETINRRKSKEDDPSQSFLYLRVIFKPIIRESSPLTENLYL